MNNHLLPAPSQMLFSVTRNNELKVRVGLTNLMKPLHQRDFCLYFLLRLMIVLYCYKLKQLPYYCIHIVYVRAFSGLELHASHEWRTKTQNMYQRRTPLYRPFCAYLYYYTYHVSMLQCLKTRLSSPRDSSGSSRYTMC